jgi:hypothetical protein
MGGQPRQDVRREIEHEHDRTVLEVFDLLEQLT